MGQWVGSGHITKNQINLELIAIIQFCLKMEKTWGQHEDNVEKHVDNMGTTGMWRPHGDNVETTWGPQGCGDHVGTLWRQCGDNVRTMWRQHGDNVGTMGMWRPCGDILETTWGQRGDNRDVETDESVVFAGKLVIETKIRLYIHYIYLHTTNLYES